MILPQECVFQWTYSHIEGRDEEDDTAYEELLARQEASQNIMKMLTPENCSKSKCCDRAANKGDGQKELSEIKRKKYFTF